MLSVCQRQCSCAKCVASGKEGMETNHPEPESPVARPPPNHIVEDMLRQQLETCRDDLYTSSSEEVALVGADIYIGLSKNTITSIAKDYMSINQEAALYGVSCLDVRICIYNILKIFIE